MKTIVCTLLVSIVTLSHSAFAGFNTGEQNLFPQDFAVKVLNVNGHQVKLGRQNADAYGNFSDEEINVLIPLIAQAIQKLPSGETLRAQSHQRLLIQIVKGAQYTVERQADRPFLRVPALTAITLTIPANAFTADVASFLEENVSLTAAQTPSRTNNVAGFMRDLVTPRDTRDLNGCELHLLNLLAPHY